MKHKFFLDPQKLCWWCNYKDVKVVSITFVPRGGWCVFFYEKQERKEHDHLISLKRAYKWLEENLAKETCFIGSGHINISFKNVLKKFKKAMKSE